MKMRLLLTGVILLWGIDAFSQTNWDDQNRYWYYRYRLVNDFLVRGEENPIDCSTATGYSLPAGNTFFDQTDIEWGDATSYLNTLSFDISDLQSSILSVEIKSMDINRVERLVKKDK